jgi:hypothetical protein
MPRKLLPDRFMTVDRRAPEIVMICDGIRATFDLKQEAPGGPEHFRAVVLFRDCTLDVTRAAKRITDVFHVQTWDELRPLMLRIREDDGDFRIGHRYLEEWLELASLEPTQ